MAGSRPPATPPVGLPAAARAAVLAWYDDRGRALAFRASRDPYAILVSEVMAQQTQIARVVDAWTRFLARFPTVQSLAASSPSDVLRAWQGMGYDRRALNLRRAAIAIVENHGGVVPDTVATLEQLPGVGPYTARAVAAIAFRRPVGAVDTNVRRVLGRSIGGTAGADWPAARMQAVADAVVDRARPGDWTHALMDVGATVCRPTNPRCEECPLRAWCRLAGEFGGSGAGPARRRHAEPATPFTSTRRWLRGRIVDRLREVDGAAWTAIPASIGSHDAAAVHDALEALAHDGVIELDPTARDRARLATS